MRQSIRRFWNTTCWLLLLASPIPAAGAEWPQWRGDGGRGVSENVGLVDRWSATTNVAWKTEIPGRGWSSPIVWGNRVFLTTMLSGEMPQAAPKGLYSGESSIPSTPHQWKVLCLDIETGQIVWERLVHEGIPAGPIHLKNSFASETPVTDGERVYCYFGNVGLFCFDFHGGLVWSRKLKPQPTRFGWGPAASPALHDGRLYLVNDNEAGSYLLALDAATGKEIWSLARDEGSNWSSPFIWRNERRTEIVTAGTGKVRSYDLAGRLLWSLEGMSSITIATPYESNGLLYVSSGYVGDALKPIYAIRPGATGDISLRDRATSNQWIAWRQPTAAPYNPTTLAYQDRLYVLHDRGLITSFDARSGAAIDRPRRIPNGRSFTSSPWAYNGKLFCLNEDGVTFVLNAADPPELLHMNPLAPDDMCMASPAIVGDRLLIRTSARLYCIRGRSVAMADPRRLGASAAKTR